MIGVLVRRILGLVGTLFVASLVVFAVMDCCRATRPR